MCIRDSPKTYKNQDGMYFAVWAPHAAQVSLVGDFNGWNPDANPMSVLADSGIWEIFIPGMSVGELYKYAITTKMCIRDSSQSNSRPVALS